MAARMRRASRSGGGMGPPVRRQAFAFFFGFTSSATPLQLFAFDNPNRVIEYPLGLIPLFLVPYAVMAHLLSIAQLIRDRRAEHQG